MAGPFEQGGIIGPVFEGRARKRAARERAAALSGLDFGVDELVASTADPAEAAAFNDQLKSYQQLARSMDPELQKQGLDGMETLGAAVREALKERRTQQVGFISEALRDQRDRMTKTMERQRQVQSAAEQMHSLLDQADFDPNTPLNRGVLMKLLDSSPRQLLSDPEDLADALAAVGGGGLLGSVVGLLSGTLAAEDFVFTKEDWRKLGEATYIYNSKPFLAEAEAIGASVEQLEASAQQLNMFPPGYSPTAFVMEQAQPFANPFGVRGSYPEVAPKIKPAEQARGAAGAFLDYLTTPQERPPMGPEAPEQLALDDDGGAFIHRELQPFRDDGARILVDPNTGDTWADYDNGRRVKVELSGFQKWWIRRRVAK